MIGNQSYLYHQVEVPCHCTRLRERFIILMPDYLFMRGKNVTRTLLFYAFCTIAGVASLCLFYQNNLLLTVLLLAGGIFLIGTGRKKQQTLLFFIAGGLIGVISEIAIVHFGVWSYSHPTFLGVPLWLPLAWGIGFVGIRKFALLSQRIPFMQ